MKTKQALLLIDIQNDYFPGGAIPLKDPVKAGEKASQILSWFRENSLSVIHVKHHTRGTEDGFFVPGTWGAEIHESVSPLTKEKVITKHYFNSFRETELLHYIKEVSIADLVVCGMMTDLCVDSTVRAAFDNGVNCTIISDACSTKDRQLNNQTISDVDIQHAFLSALNGTHAKVQSADEFLRNLL